MLGSRSHEQEIPRLKRVRLAVVKEHSPAANDEVNLVLCVWRLLSGIQRDRKGYVERATPEDRGRVLARRAGNMGFPLGTPLRSALLMLHSL